MAAPPLRVRFRLGSVNKTFSLPADESYAQLLQRVASEFEVEAGGVECLAGFPPVVVAVDDDSVAVSSFLRSGESVIVRQKAGVVAPPPQAAEQKHANAGGSSCSGSGGSSGSGGGDGGGGSHSSSNSSSSSSGSSSGGEQPSAGWPCGNCTYINTDGAGSCEVCGTPAAPGQNGPKPSAGAGWACGNCTYINTDDDDASSCAVCGTPAAKRKHASSGGGGSSSSGSGSSGALAVAEGRVRATRHQIADDNSCLFHAVAFAMAEFGVQDVPSRMRAAVADAVRSDPTQWNAATLGKEVSAYVAFILDPTKWGGQVELCLLSQMHKVELGCVDIQTGRVDMYGEGSGYTRRAWFLFSGIHFDCVVFHTDSGGRGGGAPARVVSPRDDNCGAQARALATSLRTQGAFTDQNTMRLVCKVCGTIVTGDYEARLHAGTTGHKDFGQCKA